MTSTPLRVLLVEDSPLDAALVAEHIRAAATEVIVEHVPTIGAATSKLRKNRFDCVLLDLSLPDARGLEALGDIHDAAPKVPIVVLSGADDEATALHAVQEGAQDYLVKGEA